MSAEAFQRWHFNWDDIKPLDIPGWNEDQVERVSASVLKCLKASRDEWRDALYAALETDHAPIGFAMRDGDEPEVGRLAVGMALIKLAEDATELAQSWLNDSLDDGDKQRLAEWRPVKYASLGKRYHLAEMLG